MRRFILPVAAILLTAACGSSDPGTSTVNEPARTSTGSSRSAAAPEHGASPAAKPKPSPTSSEKECPAVGDVIVWMKVKGIPDSAQLLGGNGYPNCQSTFDMVRSTSPNVPGACTEAAWVSDNPGYDADATPAKRPKHVQVAVGPAC